MRRAGETHGPIIRMSDHIYYESYPEVKEPHLRERSSSFSEENDDGRRDDKKDNDDKIVKLKHGIDNKDMDLAVAEAIEIDEPMPEGMERRLQWKADIYITLFMAFLYGIQFADKTMTSAATTLGLRQDLNMVHGSGYSWVGSSFYLGYLVFEFPMSYLLLRFPIAKTTAVLIVCWGAVIACAAACQGMESFLACRVLLGVFESAVMPAFVVLTAQWYKRKEHFARTCLWFAANGMGTILSNSLGYGLLVRQEKHGLAISGWRILYIIMGLITVLVGVVFYFHMPNTPSEAWFLTAEEKRWQVERIRENKQGYGTHKIKWYQVGEALIDPLTWLYCATVLLNNIPNGGITTFLNLILSGMHYDTKQSLLMALPCGGAELVGLSVIAVASSYIGQNHRMAWACSCAAVSLLSLCLVAWGPNGGSQLAGLYIWYAASPTSYVGLISCIESNSAGHTKKLTTNAVFLICFCVGNLVGPQTFKTSEEPEYPTGKTSMAATSACQLLLEVLIVMTYVWRNWRRNKKNQRLPPDIVNPEFADLTDFENPEFRYAL